MGKIISMVVKKSGSDNRSWLVIGSAVVLIGRSAFFTQVVLV